MNFDTTHEYYMNDPCVHYSKEHDSLMICSHGRNTERLVISGLEAGVMNRFRLELNKEELEDVVNQDVPA
tara:strand:- start:1193 stop:1402 length:210 start_codon:yes stop_codon:yes gene_type:complete